MDVVAATASIGQLVQYGGEVTLTLIRLVKDIGEGPLAFKNEEGNVRLLLRLVYKISTETGCHSQNDEFVELFKKVESIAQNILQLLDNTSSFVFRIISAVSKHRSISEAFQALCATRELLHLYVTTSLSQDVRAHLKARTHDMGNVSNLMNRAGILRCIHVYRNETDTPCRIPVEREERTEARRKAKVKAKRGATRKAILERRKPPNPLPVPVRVPNRLNLE